MDFALHPDFRIRKLSIGREHAPLVVIDNLVANADRLVDLAATRLFGDVTSYYPGVRSKAPLTYQRFIIDQLRDVFIGYFGFGAAARFTGCHFSLVTTPSEKLDYLQRIPHIDSVYGNELAFIHYLFSADLGGTAFYRHRATGYEYIDEARRPAFRRIVDEEEACATPADAGYINGDTPLYERIDHQDGVFNRMLLYRRNSLHSSALTRKFVPDLNPRAGRLSINGFLA
jgi:hypothetical protein